MNSGWTHCRKCGQALIYTTESRRRYAKTPRTPVSISAEERLFQTPGFEEDFAMVSRDGPATGIGQHE